MVTSIAGTSSTTSAEPTITVLLSCLISLTVYKITSKLVPFLSNDLVNKGLKGRDMLKPGYSSTKKDSNEEEEEDVPGKKYLPEATGVIGASVYILLLSLFAPLPYLFSLLPSSSSTSSFLSSLPTLNTTNNLHNLAQISPEDPCHKFLLLEGSLNFPHHSFATYLASLLSLLIATFLGFCDDVFDIRWRFKLPIPVIASVPLLVTYAAGHGVTDVVLPRIFGIREFFGAVNTNGVVHLGPLYYLYMSMLSTFCTNSINILAGINGVEVGQALIIAISIVLNDLLYLSFSFQPLLSLLVKIIPSSLISSQYFPQSLIDLLQQGGDSSVWTMGFSRGSQELSDRHLFSLYFMVPLIGVCFGLLRHNWYPAQAFIGDTFCYFSGMSFAVVGILGHFSKTLLLFFLPQIFNFLYSTPQLFGFVECPRHRLPRLLPSEGKEEGEVGEGKLGISFARVKPKNLRSRREEIGVGLLRFVEKFGLVKLVREGDDRMVIESIRTRDGTKVTVNDEKKKKNKDGEGKGGEIIGCSNLTILNLLLLWFGPMREDRLTSLLMVVQAFGSIVAFGIRYGAGEKIYGGDGNRR